MNLKKDNNNLGINLNRKDDILLPVKVREEKLSSYPLVTMSKEDFEITGKYTFSMLTYNRPSGDSKNGVANVELTSFEGDSKWFTLEFDFQYSEKERIKDAQNIASFNVRPEALITSNPKTISTTDVINKYEDVSIINVGFKTLEEKSKIKKENKLIKGSLYVDYYFSWEKNKNHKQVVLPVNVSPFMSDLEIDEDNPTEEINLNILKSENWEVQQGLTMTVEDINNFSINPQFLRAAPPITPKHNFLIASPGVRFVKIDYVPPKTIDDKDAYVQVEYRWNGRIHNERVRFQFEKTIRESAEAIIRNVPISDFAYKTSARKFPPSIISIEDFTYNGVIPLNIIDVLYNYDVVDPDVRYVPVDLIVEYRTTRIKIRKSLEFQYSKNEYISGAWHTARTENGSIEINRDFYSPEILLKIIEGSHLLNNKMLKTAKIVEGYPYKHIESIKVTNFEKSSKNVVFNIIVVEDVAGFEVKRTFEKHIELGETYEEYLLIKATADDIVINKNMLTLYPPMEISENIFKSNEHFKILSMQYSPPVDEQKSVDIKVKIYAGEKTKFVNKTIEFKKSKQEYLNSLQGLEDLSYLKSIAPSSISLEIDLSLRPPESIQDDKLHGIPSDVEGHIKYNPPKIGSKISRIFITLQKNKQKISYEQSLEFAIPRI